MTTRKVWLIKSRRASWQRAHLAVFIPNASQSNCDPSETSQSGVAVGTVVHVTGNRYMGFVHQFKVNYDMSSSTDLETAVCLGGVDTQHIQDPIDDKSSVQSNPIGTGNKIDALALHVKPPRVSADVNAPTNDTTNKTCQNWLKEYVRYLVSRKIMTADAIEIVDAHCDPPDFDLVAIQQRRERQQQAAANPQLPKTLVERPRPAFADVQLRKVRP